MAGPVPFRFVDRELAMRNVRAKLAAEALEGFYYVANNAQTALAGPAVASFTATSPILIVENNNAVPQPLPPNNVQQPAALTMAPVNIIPDYFALTATTAGSATSGLTHIDFAVVLDPTLRYSSGGTALTIANMNSYSLSGSNALIYAGTPTASAASAKAVNAIGHRSLCPTASGTAVRVIGDQFVMDFGSLEGGIAGSIVAANSLMTSIPLPALVIPPQCSMLVYIWYPGESGVASPSWGVEFGYTER
jgi:hypothetical protein